jgi:hypothetical protein
MRRNATICSLIFALVVSLAPQVSAEDSLNVNGTFPDVVNGNTKEAVIELSLPTSVTLKSDSKVEWKYLTPKFNNELGDPYVPESGIWAPTPPFQINVQPLGRRAVYRFSSSVAANLSTTLLAVVDKKTYSLTRSIRFEAGSTNEFTRYAIPALPSGFKIEVDNPDPGLDEQMIVRARFSTGAPWSPSAAGISWANKDGEIIDQGRKDAEGWYSFTVTSDNYQEHGFTLLAQWTVSYGANSRLVFERRTPLVLKLPLPSPSKTNTDIDFSCKYFKAKNNFSCETKLTSLAAGNSTLPIQIQVRINNGAWQTLKTINLASGAKTTTTVKNYPSRSQDMRAVVSSGSTVIASDLSEWETTSNSGGSSTFTESKLRAGLVKNCTLLPTRFNFLRFKSLGSTFNIYGDMLYKYGLGATTFSVLKQGSAWRVSGFDEFDRATLDAWECDYPFSTK